MDLIDEVINREGPPSDDPDDAGGFTKWGIAQNRHPELDVLHLTYEQARHLYTTEYLSHPGIDQIPFLPLQTQVFDWGVNSGPATAVKALQGTIHATPDGVVGPETLAALAVRDSRMVNNQLVGLRESFYKALVAHRPRKKKDLKGWLLRAHSFYLKP